MSRKSLAATLAATLLLVGCASASEKAGTNSSLDETAADSSPTEASATPTPTQTKEIHGLGDTVDRPAGASVTAHDYRVVTDVADHRVGAIDVEVCVGDENLPEGAYVTTEFWSALSDDNRRYGAASTIWDHDEISPVLSSETDVAWGDCLRGWVVTDASDDSNITKIRYFNSYSDDVGNEEVVWEVPQS